MVKNLNGHTFYFQAESFDSAIAWRVTIESMIMAAQSDEHSPAVSLIFYWVLLYEIFMVISFHFLDYSNEWLFVHVYSSYVITVGYSGCSK